MVFSFPDHGIDPVLVSPVHELQFAHSSTVSQEPTAMLMTRFMMVSDWPADMEVNQVCIIS